MTPTEVLGRVKTALDQVQDLRVHDHVPGSVSPPAAVVEINAITAPSMLGGGADYRVQVSLLVQRGDQRSSQDRTLLLVDPEGPVSRSVFAALLSVDEVGQVAMEGPGTIEWGGQQYAGAILTVTVFG